MVFDLASKNFSFVTFGRVGSAALFGVFYLMFAILLDPESYGNLSYLIALAGTFSVISRFGLNQSIIVYQAKKNQVLANQVNVLAVITTAVASIILIPINIFAALVCFALSLITMNLYNQLGLKKYKRYMAYEISKGILVIALSLGFYYVLEIHGILLGMAIGYFLFSFNFFRSINSKIKSFNLIRNNYKVLFHNFGVDASNNLTKFADKLLIVPLLGFTVVGIYQLNLQILIALETIPIALHAFLLSEESSGKKHKKIALIALTASVIIASFVIIASPFFIEEFFPKYSDGIFSLQILILSIIPLTIGAIFTAKLQAKESTLVGYAAIIRIGSLLALIFILGSSYGLVGLSFAILISVILNAIFLWILNKKSQNK